MTQGKLKKQLRKNRIQRNIKTGVTVGLGAVSAIAGISNIAMYAMADSIDNEVKGSEYKVNHSNKKLTAGLTADITDKLNNITVEGLDIPDVQSSMSGTDNTTNTEVATVESTEVATESAEATTESAEVATDYSSVVELIPSGSEMYTSVNMNVRETPDKNSERVGGLNAGVKVTVKNDLGNGWVEIEFKGKSAYICNEYLSYDAPLIKVSSTAYYEKSSRHSASGRKLVEGYSIAGMVKWLNKSVNIYKCNKDGSVGELLGTYRFDDTGYGAESGMGDSKILDGRTVGTIENGTCIDFYYTTESECIDYGRRNVYIQFID